ncbi:NAD(P)H dehydrogenase B2, mitochondrial [Apostasia shenzhenica]|uniref:NADH:ubiquinone reductase (non-electrogenic) n=1 Tax=Apostasia shenzhenica TaxID=1088818 RepID=A0A2I0ADC9_9ASPA|nr:NAD(P)H dehydrogenase B2, mitochondrial [Apostasia shenzhenica]
MRFAGSFFDGASKVFRHRPTFFKLVVILAGASTGGLVAYADSKSGLNVQSSQGTSKRKVVVLGTGWAATSFLRNLDSSLYDVKVISPRNYFAFTPLLPSVTCGTVEARSVVEPIRRIIRKLDIVSFDIVKVAADLIFSFCSSRQKVGKIKFWEAECFKIDPTSKIIHCRSTAVTNPVGTDEFVVDYDYLVIAVGAQANTFNTPGVEDNCHFLKEVEDAQRIRSSVIDCFEKACLPDLDEEDRKKYLHFVIIGGGPTGVEFAAELHDFVTEDLSKLYPSVSGLVKISVIGAGEHLLTMFDERISKFAEEKFQRDGIELKTGFKVVKVSVNDFTMKAKSTDDISVPYGMAVWSAGIGTRPVILDFMKQIGQGGRRALATDEWLRVCGCDGVYALGDCATISQRKVMEDITEIFRVADKDNSGTLTMKEIQDVLEDICIRYPQVELYLKSKHVNSILELLKDSKGDVTKEAIQVDIEEFKKALAVVDSQVKTLPATAQVAAQQGDYLARCFNKIKDCEEHPEGPLRIREAGRHQFRPFLYVYCSSHAMFCMGGHKISLA